MKIYADVLAPFQIPASVNPPNQNAPALNLTFLVYTPPAASSYGIATPDRLRPKILVRIPNQQVGWCLGRRRRDQLPWFNLDEPHPIKILVSTLKRRLAKTFIERPFFVGKRGQLPLMFGFLCSPMSGHHRNITGPFFKAVLLVDCWIHRLVRLPDRLSLVFIDRSTPKNKAPIDNPRFSTKLITFIDPVLGFDHRKTCPDEMSQFVVDHIAWILCWVERRFNDCVPAIKVFVFHSGWVAGFSFSSSAAAFSKSITGPV